MVIYKSGNFRRGFAHARDAETRKKEKNMFLKALHRRIKTESANEFGVSVKTNVRYGDYADAVCDVYRLGEGRLPVIVHFTDSPGKSDRSDYSAMASAIAAKNKVFVVAKTSVESLKAMTDCLRQMEEYLKLSGAGEKMDVNTLFFSGDGTGAWSALKAAGAATRGEPGFSIKPTGVMLFSGIPEPMELARLDLRSAKNALKYGFGVHGSADTIPESAVKEICPGFPPVFFLHSDADNLSFSQTAQLRSALKRAEVKYSEYRAAYRNVKRDFYLDAGSRPEADSALAAAARFADKCLNNELRIDEYTEI